LAVLITAKQHHQIATGLDHDSQSRLIASLGIAYNSALRRFGDLRAKLQIFKRNAIKLHVIKRSSHCNNSDTYGQIEMTKSLRRFRQTTSIL
jgi:hypothetical protein